VSTIATRKPDLPLAACDITRNLLHRGDWYHRRGFASDLCTAEWKKLSPEQQADYIQVQSLDDLGEQVRLPHDGHLSALNAAADTSLCSQAGLYQQHNDKVVPQTNLGTISLDSKKSPEDG
jgi:hypothetical protein